jgi:predicted ATPase/class 3 adenylate cyclase
VDRTLPTGLVTFAFTDVEGSTRLFERVPDLWPALQRRQRTVVLDHASKFGGVAVHSHGDGNLIAFPSADGAVAACLAAQRELVAVDWPDGAQIRVRMALHAGAAEPVEDDYVAYAVHEAARLMDCAHGGQILLSEAVARGIESWPDGSSIIDLGQHRLRDLPGLWRLLQVVHPGLPRAFPPPRAEAARQHNLPSWPPLIGRAEDVSAVSDALDRHRLVTVVGVGGVGKTRLAVETARLIEKRFPDGVWLVELADRSDPGSVARTLAEVLEVADAPDHSLLDSIAERLRTRATLLVVDNCEHMIGEAASTIDTLQRRCVNLRVLATSREPLHLPSESVVRLAGLSHESSIDSQSDANHLFVARVAERGLTLDIARDGRAVDDICRQVEGHALSIELLAGLVDSLTPAELARGLEQFLSGATAARRRGGQTRHASIDDAIAWSFELLTDAQQRLLTELSVFAGTWTATTAAQVCTAQDVASGVRVLVDKSVVTAEFGVSPEMRYRLLLPVRAAAAQRLGARTAHLRDRHATWCGDLARRAAASIEGSEAEMASFSKIDTDHPNVLAALDHLEQTDPDAALELAAALGRFWRIRGYWRTGCERLERAYNLAQDTDTATGATALRYLGQMKVRCGLRDDGIAMLRRAIRGSDELGVPDLRGAARLDLVSLLQRDGEWEEAATLNAATQQIAAASPDNHLLQARCLELAGRDALHRGDHDQALAVLADALVSYDAGGHRLLQTSILTSLGNLALDGGRHEVARNYYVKADTLAREAKDVHAEIVTLANLANVAHQLGDFVSARAYYEETLRLARERFDLAEEARTVGMLALLDWDEGNLANARALFEQAAATAAEADGRAAALNWSAAVAAVAVQIGDRLGARIRLREVVESDVLPRDPQLVAEVAGIVAALRVLEQRDVTDLPRLLAIAQSLRTEEPRPGERALLDHTHAAIAGSTDPAVALTGTASVVEAMDAIRRSLL